MHVASGYITGVQSCLCYHPKKSDPPAHVSTEGRHYQSQKVGDQDFPLISLFASISGLLSFSSTSWKISGSRCWRPKKSYQRKKLKNYIHWFNCLWELGKQQLCSVLVWEHLGPSQKTWDPQDCYLRTAELYSLWMGCEKMKSTKIQTVYPKTLILP